MTRIIIIGGGITGLATANRLMELSQGSALKFEVTLLESSSKLGGTIQTTHRDDFLLEHGPDSFISEKPATLELIRRLGIESQLLETNKDHRRSFIVRNGKLRPVPKGFQLIGPSLLWPFVTSDIFSWPGKVRMALDLVLPRRSSSENYDESLAQFVRRRLGREALERMAQPMVGGIYTADPERLSLRATMPRFLEMEQKHRSLIRALIKERKAAFQIQRVVEEESVSGPGSPDPVSPAGQPRWTRRHRTLKEGTSGARYGLFLSFGRGMQVLTDKLAERILNFKFPGDEGANSAQVCLQVNTAVESLNLERHDGSARWLLKTGQSNTLAADAVCLALPAYISARLLASVDGQLASELDGICYASSATINLAYKRADIPHPLDGFGFV